MATVTGFTAARMLEIENSTVVSGEVVGDDLVLQTRDSTAINAGNVRGEKGDPGDPGDPGPEGPPGESGVPSIQTITIEDADGFGSVELAPAILLIDVTLSDFSRFRLYRSEEGRDADASRPVEFPYTPDLGRGLVYSVIGSGTDSENAIAASSADSSFYYYNVEDGPVDVSLRWAKVGE